MLLVLLVLVDHVPVLSLMLYWISRLEVFDVREFFPYKLPLLGNFGNPESLNSCFFEMMFLECTNSTIIRNEDNTGNS